VEIEEAYRIWSLAFERGSRQMDHWRRGGEGLPEGSVTAGIYEAGKLQAVIGIINFRSYFGSEAILPLGGIAAVASLPASRGQGYAGACIDFALSQMRESGQVISALYPFQWDFYHRYGWDWVGALRQYTIPTAIIKPFPETESVREASESDHGAIQETYARHARHYRGSLVRTDYQWNGILADTDSQYASVYVYEAERGIEGYIAYRGYGSEEMELREFVSLTPAALRGLLGLLRRQQMQFRKVSWKAPEDDPLWSQQQNWQIDTKLRPVFMGRIVDVPGALQAWKPARDVSGAVRLEVKDDHASWNEGAWQIASEDGKISVQKTTKAPQVSLDIQALSQAYFGRPNLTELRHAGRVSVHDEGSFQSLCSLLAGPPTWENDFF
jgi:predicted acetyltransferase